MSDDELTAMVNEIGSRDGICGPDTSTMYGEFALEVAKAVRERCAKLCDEAACQLRTSGSNHEASALESVAEDLRG